VIELTRKQFLQGVSGAATLLLSSTLVKAIESAKLQADLSVIDARVGEFCTAAKLRLENRTGQAIRPVPVVYGTNRGQSVWKSVGGQPTVEDDHATEWWVRPRKDDKALKLLPDRRNAVRVFDEGTDRRVEAKFVPTEVDG
jgi:hypothetical protein